MKLRLVGALAVSILLAPSAFAQRQTVQGAPVSGIPTNRSTLNNSATITAGNTFQQVLAANSSSVQRQSLTIENNNASDNCWLFIGPTASATKARSILLTPGGSYTRYWPYVPSDNIAATCATTSDTLYIDNN